MATAQEKEALGLTAAATDAEVMARIVELTGRDVDPATGHATGDKHLVLWSVNRKEFRRAGIVIPAEGSIVIDESDMSKADLAILKAEPAIGNARTSDPVTPESEIQRYRRPGDAPAAVTA